ncbi:gliding motility ABC transporter [Leptospira gomenensis]|uniref:Gliding motility ABC transporter n=1 Tax=Leptospira gomenensis TaxID=2484974 RepID=A0A5F1YGJ6_9LEPT|nr:ABC transporter permease subunit [Leptospira gomenensis]TGK38599.1 gliding motility ABC transporter [Leptospira gomenensis]TGK42836.1 gliding motility ABC transporter [Leptospira gomenensis]TGK49619.1 gliding motility ABC transporter [Leptospira gomenensis]TGK60711.1 gliding motility ABC transporter [Leptospira gomenensis]
MNILLSVRESWSRITAIFRKETIVYTSTPIGTLFACLFLSFVSFLFFFGLGETSFWDLRTASLESYFQSVPILYLVFIPALTMRLWSEEERTGTIELLFTFPLRDFEIVLGKFLSAWAFLGFVLLCTVTIPLSVFYLGNLDMGIILASYLGTFLLGGSNLVLGSLASSLTKEQSSAYLLAFLFCSAFFLFGYKPLEPLLGGLGDRFSFFSLSYRYETFRLGILDFGNVFFYLSFDLLVLYGNVLLLRSKR